jgi:hypothetical protein
MGEMTLRNKINRSEMQSESNTPSNNPNPLISFQDAIFDPVVPFDFSK